MTTQKPYSQIAYLFAQKLVNTNHGLSVAGIAYAIDEAIDMARQEIEQRTRLASAKEIIKLARTTGESSADAVWNQAIMEAMYAVTDEILNDVQVKEVLGGED